MNTRITTRIAPSPTGKLHIGTARTALFNYLFAKKHGGTFIVRSEDTDRARSTKEYEAEILEGLEWLGFEADQFYRQSERTLIYRNHLETLIETGRAYISKEPSKADPATIVEVVRLKNPNRDITFTDLIRGDITFNTTELGDFVIARSVDDALYHFTVVVDDFLSEVTHVIRGEDHISNTPRQILIGEAIGAPRPAYAHLPLILAPDRSKMSKRHGATSISEYREQGFIPPAIINYLGLLGWNPGTTEEVFTLPELIEAFDISHIHKSGAVFDREKFLWFNREHLRRMSDALLTDTVNDLLPVHLRNHPKLDHEGLEKLLPLIRERVHTLGEISKAFREGDFQCLFEEPAYERELLKWKKDTSVDMALPRLEHAHELLASSAPLVTADDVRALLVDYGEEVGRGELLWPLRVALSGRERSLDPFTLIALLGVEGSLRRIETACDKIRGNAHS
jgi:glutamyl-tRNA synthetase